MDVRSPGGFRRKISKQRIDSAKINNFPFNDGNGVSCSLWRRLLSSRNKTAILLNRRPSRLPAPHSICRGLYHWVEAVNGGINILYLLDKLISMSLVVMRNVASIFSSLLILGWSTFLPTHTFVMLSFFGLLCKSNTLWCPDPKGGREDTPDLVAEPPEEWSLKWPTQNSL